MKTQVQFLQIPGVVVGLYRTDNGQMLDAATYLVIDSHGNYRLIEKLCFHGAPLYNGQVLDITLNA